MDNSVEALTFENLRVGQMCDACLAPYLAARQRQTAVTGRGLLLATASCVPGALLGAVVWAGCWLLYLAITDAMARLGIAWVPTLILVAFMVGVGLGVGWAVTWYVRRVQGRGDIHAGVLGAVMATLGIVLGEFLFGLICVAWFAEVFSVPLAFRFVARYWTQLGFWEGLIRGGTAAASIVMAAVFARPRLERIPL